jgi:hypothetical protein
MKGKPVPQKAITAVAWNIEKGKNLAQAAEWIRAQAPDLFFMQELQPGQLDTIGDLLKMTGYAAAKRPGSNNDNAIFLRPDSPLVFVEEHKQDWAPWHAPCNITVRLRDADGTLSPRQISAVSGHACYWSPTIRQIESEWYSTLAKSGWLAMVFEDSNSYRKGEGGPWNGYTGHADYAFYANRTYQADDGSRRTDDRPAEQMRAAGYVEIAHYAAKYLALPDALRPTSGYRDNPGRPPAAPYCIDRGYLTPELAPALDHFEVCDTPELQQISDHLPRLAIYAHDRLHTILHRPARVYEPNIITDGFPTVHAASAPQKPTPSPQADGPQ